MKNTFNTILLLGLLIPISFVAQTRCDTLGAVVKGMLQNDGNSFYSDGQSYKYFLNEEETTEIVTTFYEGTIYRIATSAGLEDNYMVFDILDEKYIFLIKYDQKSYFTL